MTNPRRTLPAILLLAALGLVACTSGGGASAPPSVSPTGSPLIPDSGAPSAPADGPITSPEEAWAAVVAAEPRFANIGPLDPELIGQSAWYEVMPASGVGAFVVSVTVGWGDCPSGCIDKHTWQYAVAPDGTVTLQSESGPEPPADAFPTSGGSDAY